MVPGAFDAIAELVAITDGNTWIVSKASSVTQAANRLWLGQTGFYQRTGFPAGNIWFCERRADKAGICRNLSICHFVDDQLEVLNHLREIVPNLYHFGVDPILTWQDVLSAMRA